jgi:hypothetical protein
MRVTGGMVVGFVAGRIRDEILREYPYLEAADIAESLSYPAWRAQEVEVPLSRHVMSCPCAPTRPAAVVLSSV